MRRNRADLMWVAILILSLCWGLACDDDDSGGTSNAALCRKGCLLYRSCSAESNVDLTECTKECTDYFSSVNQDPCEPEIRDYYVCAVNLSCNDVYFDDYALVAQNGKCAMQIAAMNVCESGDTGESDTEVDGDACETCLGSECESELSACAQNTDCLPLMECLGNCADDTCSESCATQYPGGLTSLVDILECSETYCSTECM